MEPQPTKNAVDFNWPSPHPPTYIHHQHDSFATYDYGIRIEWHLDLKWPSQLEYASYLSYFSLPCPSPITPPPPSIPPTGGLQ